MAYWKDREGKIMSNMENSWNRNKKDHTDPIWDVDHPKYLSLKSQFAREKVNKENAQKEKAAKAVEDKKALDNESPEFTGILDRETYMQWKLLMNLEEDGQTERKNRDMKDIYSNITWFFRRLKRVLDFLPIIWRGYDFDYAHAIELFRYQLERTADLLESDKAYTIDSNIHAQKIRTAIKLMDKVYDEEYMEDFYDKKISIEEAIKKQERAHQLVWKYIEHNIQGWWD